LRNPPRVIDRSLQVAESEFEVKGKEEGRDLQKADEKLKNETHLGRNANPLNAGE
jgi:hypothetical protein